MDGNGGAAAYISIVVDVEGVIAAFPSDDVDALRLLDDDGQYVVATTADNRNGDAVSIEADVGDLLRVYAISGSCNFESAVLLDGVHADVETDSDRVVGRFTMVTFEQIPVTPAASPLTLAADEPEQEFVFWQAAILGLGTRRCVARLALYDRDAHGQPHFTGLYRWAFSLTVNPNVTDNNTNPGGT